MRCALTRDDSHLRPIALIALFVLVVASWIFSGTSPAISHNAVISTTPEAGSTVSDNPVEIRIVTSDQLLDLGGSGSGFAIVVRDEQGLYYGDGCVTVGDSDMFTVARLGSPGDYTVTYQFVSADGHSLSDLFTFEFAPTDSDNPADGVPEPPVCGATPAPVGDPVEQAVDETTVTDLTDAPDGVVADPIEEEFEVEEPERGPITIAIAAVLIVLSITLLVWMVVRRNRG